MEWLDGWHDFFVAQVGASAALSGLLFVAISINIERILKMPWLPSRAANTMVFLLGSLIESSLGLWPHQSSVVLGSELVLVTLAVAYTVWQIARVHPRTPKEYSRGTIFAPIVAITAIAGAIAILAFASPYGMFVLAGSMLLAMVLGFANAWVLLVEILR